jgi:hypothetical protein
MAGIVVAIAIKSNYAVVAVAIKSLPTERSNVD